MARSRRPRNKALKWALVAGLAAFLLAVDWVSDGVGPRLVFGAATLELTSTPAGARVLLDGQRIGETPLTFDGARPGRAVVRLEHRFHDAEVRRLELARDEVLPVHVEFAPAAGALEITSNPVGAELRIDGVALDEAAPVVLESQPTGRYEVTATIYGRETETRAAEVLPRQRTEVAFELERVPMGEVFFDLTPGDAKVALVDLEQAYERGMRLPVGEYRFRIARAGYATVEKPLKIEYGRNLHAVRLDREHGELSIRVHPPGAAVEIAYGAGRNRRVLRYEGDATEVRIPTGAVDIRAEAIGFHNYEQRLTLKATKLAHPIRLRAFDVEPGRRFRDALASGGEGPMLVIVPAGEFRMGSEGGAADERPVRTVTVAQPFAIGVFEVTRAEYARAGLAYAGAVDAAADPRHPATALRWHDAQAYVEWLGEETGHRYRLPSEAEWEYAARAGSATRFWFGDDGTALCAHENIADETLAARYSKYDTVACTDGALGLAPVGGFTANAFGVHDMLGNAREWVADCWHRSHRNAPANARARGGDCNMHVVRGGAWDSAADAATVSFRSFSAGTNPSRGFRVARDL